MGDIPSTGYPSKVLTSERGVLHDDSINTIRVTGSGHVHKMAITPSLMQSRRSSYAVYAKCMEEEQERNEKDMQQKTKTANEDQYTQNIIQQLKSRKRSLLEEHKSTTKEQATQ